ncbi:PREDICTED: uncharacterized protein LOC104701472 [Camelina sativa]|uniref:Uncharacterized protein LOC104701472 n=1 Tax=Camelina sativa TaxID=90675 RepID=A0ABM0SSD6_CAMSA|nr:PREDICTED: uncharacterized protein LOC104701472 [Camelina sativa]
MTISSSQVEIKTRSPVWDHRNRCKCNYYAIGLKCVTTSGTSNLAKHLKTCKPYIAWQQRATQQNLNSGSGVTAGNMQVDRVSEAVFREACNEMFVLGELPPAFIESIAWRHFWRRVQLYQPHSRKTATRDIVQMQ